MKIASLLLALGLAFGGVAPFADPAVDEGSLELNAAPSASGALRDGQDLLVSGTVTNSTGQTMDAGDATLLLSRTPIASATALAEWLDPERSAAGERTGAELGRVPIGELAPGQVRAFSIVVPAASVALPEARFGVFPLAVQIAAHGVQLDQSTSAIVWSPAGAAPTHGLTILKPIIAPPGTVGVLDAQELAELTAPDGILTTQLNDALDRSVALGIDPMILASIRLLGTSAPESAIEWLTRLAGATNETFALSYADSDIAATRQAGAPMVLGPTGFAIDPALFAPPTDEIPSATPTPPSQPPAVPPLPTAESLLEWPFTVDGIAWPAPDSVVANDLDSFHASGLNTTILNSGVLSGNLGTSTMATVGGRDVLITDDGISAFLRAAVGAASPQDWQSAMSSLAASLAIAAQAHPGANVVAALGRTIPDADGRLAQTLDALSALPWVTSGTLTEALAMTPVAASLTESPEQPERVTTVANLLRGDSAGIIGERQVSEFASVLTDPSQLTGPRRLALLALLSHSWGSDPAGWSEATTAHLTRNSEIVNSVRIPDSSTINLLSDNFNLPITVSNELAFPVTVYVTVQPERAILNVLDSRVALTIEANSQAKAQVPVQSIANGEVRTTVSLTSGSNVRISQPTVVDLNVQAGWETAATVVLAGLVIGIFAVGVWRTIARRRKARKEAAEP